MKTNFLKTGVVLLLLGVVFVGCRNGEPSELTLANTQWRLVGMVNSETGELTVLEPFNHQIGVRPKLTFEVDTIRGRSFSNSFFGTYKADYATGDIGFTFLGETRINEPRDGELFLMAVYFMQTFVLCGNELRLFSYYPNKYWPDGFYDVINNSYLLFKRVGL